MTEEDRFDVVTEVRLIKKELSLFKEDHEKMAMERQQRMLEKIDDLKETVGGFVQKCTGPQHAQAIFRLFIWCSILSLGLSILFALHGITVDVNKILPKVP